MKTKFRHRLFSVTLVLCMLLGTLSVLPVTVFAVGEAKITPSATGGTYDESTNTLTVVGGGEVSFTPSSGIEFSSVDGTKQPSSEDEPENPIVDASFDGTKWIVTLPNEDAEYIFRGYYSVEVAGSTSTKYAECIVTVIERTPLVYADAEKAVSIEFSAADGVAVPAGASLKVDNYAVTADDVRSVYISTLPDGNTIDERKEIVYEDVTIGRRDPMTIKTETGDMEVRLGEIITINDEHFVVHELNLNGSYVLVSLSDGSRYTAKMNRSDLFLATSQLYSVEKVHDVYKVNGTTYIAQYKLQLPNGKFSVVLHTVDGSPAGILYSSGVAHFNQQTNVEKNPYTYADGVLENGVGGYVINTNDGFKRVLTVWSGDVYFSADGTTRIPLPGVLNMGIADTATTVVHIGDNGVDVGTKADDGWNIAMSDQSPVIAFNVSDFEMPTKTVSLTVGLVDEPQAPGGLSTGAIVAIVISCVVVLAGGGFALYWFVLKKKKLG